MNGLVTPLIRCKDTKGPVRWDAQCAEKVYIPPAYEGTAVNPFKGLTATHLQEGGDDGPLPVPGIGSGNHSSLVASQEGVGDTPIHNNVTGDDDLLCQGFVGHPIVRLTAMGL